MSVLPAVAGLGAAVSALASVVAVSVVMASEFVLVLVLVFAAEARSTRGQYEVGAADFVLAR